MKRNVFLSSQFVMAMSILVVAAGGLQATILFMGIHLHKLPLQAADDLAFRSLPIETESWIRYRQDPPPLSAEMVDELGTDNYLLRVYAEKESGSSAARVFELHCAYYTGKIDTVPHVPERCFVGNGGLTMESSIGTIVPVPIDLELYPLDPFVDAQLHGEIRRGRTSRWSSTPGQYVLMPRKLELLTMNVSRYVSETGVHLFAGYFFIANGGTVPRAEQVRQLAFRHEDKYAYFAKIQFTSSSVETAEQLGELAGAFLTEMLPDLMRRTPDWVAVKEGRYPVSSSDVAQLHSSMREQPPALAQGSGT